MKQVSPKNKKEYKSWIKTTVNSLYKLGGIGLIERSQEFFAITEDQYTEAEIKYTQKTNDKKIEKEFAFLRDEIRPLLIEASAKIAKIAIRKNDYPKKFKQYLRAAKVTHELFHPDIPNLQKEEAKLETEYTKKFSSLTIEFQGETYPISMSKKFMESFDRDTRKEVWNSIKKAIVENQDFFEDNYLNLIKIRQEIAKKAKCKNYIEYQFKKKLRDYTSQDCYAYHEAVKKYITPKVTELQKKRKEILRVNKLYPYDMTFSINSEYELKPFDSKDERKLVEGTKLAIKKVSLKMADYFQEMYEDGKFDLLAREHKAPGGYNASFYTQPHSFIFMNAAGVHDDLNTLAHEQGHAWHGKLINNLKYPFEKNYSMEIAEVASTFLEYASSQHTNYFYSEKELKWALTDQWESEIATLSWIAIIDKFQHEVYSKESLTNEELRDIWKNILNQFRGKEVYWDEDKDLEIVSYAKQRHLFIAPFYYIEYAISLMAAVQLLKIYEKNPEEGLRRYNNGLSLGNTVSTKEVYEQGFQLPLKFGDEQVKTTLDFLNEKLNLSSKY